MSELESDLKMCELLNSAAERIAVAVVSKNESDPNSNRTLESVETVDAEGVGLQCQTTVTDDGRSHSQPLTAECELFESENTSTCFNMKDSNVDESAVVDCRSSPSAVDKLPSPQPLDLPEPVADINTERSSLQLDSCDAVSKDLSSETASLSSVQCSSKGCQPQTSESAGLKQQATDRSENSADADRPSTVIVISAHQSKDTSTLCQPDLQCDVTESDVDTFSETDNVPERVADLYMCCSNDDTSAVDSCSDLPIEKQNNTADSSVTESLNESVMTSDNMATTTRVVRPKQNTTTNGTASLLDCIIFFFYYQFISSFCSCYKLYECTAQQCHK